MTRSLFLSIINKTSEEGIAIRTHKKWFWPLALLTLLVTCFLLFFQFRKVHEADTPLQHASNSEFWLLSDIHFLSSTLHDNGEAFQTFTQGAAGKEMTYQEQSIEAFTAQALKEKPTGIILTGDMTLNGEKASAQELARLLAPLQEADIMVFALPGNHEIYNGWARAFKGEKEYYADQISPEDFQKIFAEGYEKANSIDKSSLSYSIQLNDKYRLFLLDSCIYDSEVNWDDPTTNGELKPATLTWLEEQLTLTKEAEQVPLVFLHHNLFSHNELLQDGYVLDNASETVTLLDRFNVPAVFSGHIHIQDINEGNDSLYEAVTGSYSTAELGYGVLSLSDKEIDYEARQIDLDAWAAETKQTDEQLLDYQNYQKSVFENDTDQLVRDQLSAVSELSDAQITQLCTFVTKLNTALFTGNDTYSAEKIAAIKDSEEYQWLATYSYFLKQYVDSMLDDQTDDRKLTIPLTAE